MDGRKLLVMALLLAGAMVAAPARAEVVSHWALDEPAGTTGVGSVADAVDGNHGTPTGGVTAPIVVNTVTTTPNQIGS